MPIKIAINGFGRIGRPALRSILEKKSCQVVAINDLTDTATLAHLLKYDSNYGIYDKSVEFTEKSLIVDGKEILVFSEKDPENLPWKKMDVDVVLECTGLFTNFEGSQKHLKAGAKKVIISAPSKDPDKIPSYILGINEEKFDSEKDKIIDMGSCTTNCLAPIVKVLNDEFGIVKGFMSTIHSYTNDQKILDLPHKDLRRARAAALNIIPTSTGAAKAIGNVIPEVKGKLDGIAFRVPTPVVSVLDLTCELGKTPSAKEVNDAFRKAGDKRMVGILKVETEQLVSSDYIANPYSSIVDASLTMIKDNIVKIVSWYDNEYAYALRLGELAEYIGKK